MNKSDYSKNNKCIDCGKKISPLATRCLSCAQKERLKIPGNNPSFIHGLTNTKEYKQKILRKFVLKKYNISIKQYEILFKKQKGLCAICNKPESSLRQDGSIKNLAVDHNHKTEEIRGLLCNACNIVLGYTYDNINILQKMIHYLLGE